MGKGDKKSKKGKIWRDSYGNSRRKRTIKARLKRVSSKKTEEVSAVSATTEVAAAKPKRVTKKKDA
ncbi:MAG: 30S ribosomal protein THX [Cyclobacteriaceae bacterium]|nr:30S ribosomal protein THX [Cyclobacteriaceae bacterium]